jgi:hypothetical protein
MSQFLCICGKVTRSDEEPRNASSVLYSIADLQDAEDRIGRLLADYLVAADRPAWVRANFGSSYPEDLSEHELISDVVSHELGATYTSMFCCPHCGRIAMKGSAEDTWRFFEMIRPSG